MWDDLIEKKGFWNNVDMGVGERLVWDEWWQEFAIVMRSTGMHSYFV